MTRYVIIRPLIEPTYIGPLDSWEAADALRDRLATVPGYPAGVEPMADPTTVETATD